MLPSDTDLYIKDIMMLPKALIRGAISMASGGFP
jgi:hypothetical protein